MYKISDMNGLSVTEYHFHHDEAKNAKDFIEFLAKQWKQKWLGGKLSPISQKDLETMIHDKILMQEV